MLVLWSGTFAASDPPLHDRATAARAVDSALAGTAYANQNAPVVPVSKHPLGDSAGMPRLAKGVFLVASRELVDPNFRRTVVLLVSHGEDGAMGVVVNRRTSLTLGAVLPDIAELAERSDQLYIGGPVATTQITLLLRAANPPDNAEHVFHDVYFSGSLTTLMQQVREQEIAESMHAYAGYAGWAAGQLEGEVERGDWSLTEADAEILFSQSPDDIWRELNRKASGVWVRAAERAGRMAGLSESCSE